MPQLSPSPVKTNIFGERFLYNVNRDSFSKVSAKVIIDNEFGKKLFNEDSLFIIIGTDSGLLPKYIREHGIPSGTRYLFIEPVEILEQLHRHDLLDTLDDEIIYSTLEQWEEKANSLKLKGYCYLRNVNLIQSICAQQINLTEYPELHWQVTEELQSLHFKYSCSLVTQPFLVRQIYNIADNIFPAKLLKDIYKDKTAIVLAGGPSLNEVLPWVIQNRSKLIVFAVSRLSKLLIAKNIEPDFVVSVDPQVGNMDVSKEMYHFKKAIFVHSYHVDSALINQWSGIKLYLGNKFPWKNKEDVNNIEAVGTTVSNSALSTALAFGCKRVLLAGVDFCLSKEGITHTAGTDEAAIGPSYNNSSSVELETYSGDRRISNPDFHTAVCSLESQAQAVISENKKIINLAKDAAKAKYIQYIPPEEIVLDTEEYSPLSTALKHLPPLTDTLHAQYLQSSVTDVERSIYQIKSIQKLAQQALKINDKMYSPEGEIKNYKDKRALDKIESRLNKQYRVYSKLVKNFEVLSFIKITSPNDDSDSWDAEKAKKMGHIYYESYLSGAKRLLKLLNETSVRVKIRLEELKENPDDISLLIEQWNKDKSYNRASMWGTNHPQQTLSNDIKLKLEELNNQFQNLLNSTDTTFKKGIEKNSSLTLLKAKAASLFKYRKEEDLVNLEAGLNLHSAKKSEKRAYQLLISAYIAELNNNTELAMEHYDSIINEEQSPLLEEALLRVTSLSINQNDHSNALLALRCLSQISPLYIALYAESSRISGNVMDAIDSYNSYIEFFPEDIISKLKLANLYIDIKIYDAAELMLNYILTAEPENETAIQLKAQVAKLKSESKLVSA